MMWIIPLLIAVAALVVALIALLKAKRSVTEAHQHEQQLNQRIATLEHELSAMMDGAFGVASQLQKVESNLKSTVQQQEQLQQRDRGNLPYNDAVRRVSKGADVDELVEHCGLSRSEAELVTMLHKKSTDAEPAGSVLGRENRQDRAGSADTTDDQATAVGNSGSDASVSRESGVGKQEPVSTGNDADELGVSEHEQAPLFSGELGGDDFQQALEQAREFQNQFEAVEDKESGGPSKPSPKPPHKDS